MIMIMIMYHWEEAVAKWLTNDRPSKWGRLSFTSMYVSLVSLGRSSRQACSLLQNIPVNTLEWSQWTIVKWSSYVFLFNKLLVTVFYWR